MELSSGLLSSFACWISSRRHAAEQRRAYTTARPCANMLLCRRRFALFLFWPGTHTYSGRYPVPVFWFSCTVPGIPALCEHMPNLQRRRARTEKKTKGKK